jgi:hypothetical protein
MGAYYQVFGQRHSQDDTVDSNNLEKRKPSVRLLVFTYKRELYDSSDNGETKINPIAFTFVELPPIRTKTEAYLSG